MTRLRRYFIHLLIGIDQFLNTLAGGNPDDTISARLGKAMRRGNKFAAVACSILDRIDPDHCITAAFGEQPTPQ